EQVTRKAASGRAGGAPELSVVVVSVGGLDHTRRALECLRNQVDPPAFEILVAYDPAEVQVETLEAERPEVRFLAVEDALTDAQKRWSHERHHRMRALAIAAARGRIVALTEDYARVAPGWTRAIVREHARHDTGIIGGAIDNGVDRALNWAVYFADFGRYMSPLPAGPGPFASDVNVSYKRAALEAIAGSLEHGFHEPAVHDALRARGERIWLSPAIQVIEERSDLSFWPAVRERIVWGRSYAGNLARRMTPARRLLYTAGSPLLVPLLFLRAARRVFERRCHRAAFLRAAPLLFVLLMAWAAGELLGYATARPDPFRKRSG
ncbi:MAG: hypothetical protein D6760_04120, partial [Deltaproteobacteria bacterium]